MRYFNILDYLVLTKSTYTKEEFKVYKVWKPIIYSTANGSESCVWSRYPILTMYLC